MYGSIRDEGNAAIERKMHSYKVTAIIGFNQLRAILASIKEEPTEDLKKELAKWLRYMKDLHMHSISILEPASPPHEKSATSLDQIREFQGIGVELL